MSDSQLIRSSKLNWEMETEIELDDAERMKDIGKMVEKQVKRSGTSHCRD